MAANPSKYCRQTRKLFLLIHKLEFDRFRNLHRGQWIPSEGVNILHGENGQGKTNLLEACWLFTGARSFRGAKDSEMVAFGEERASLLLDFYARERDQQASLTVQNKRIATLNGIQLDSPIKLAGTLCGVVFSPEHLSLVKNGPEMRRRFVDSAYCQLKPGYLSSLNEFNKILGQRNAFLKQWEDFHDDQNKAMMLDVWDRAFAAAGARLTVARQQYCRRIGTAVSDIYQGISAGREKLQIIWHSDGLSSQDSDETPVEIAENWLSCLQAHRKEDIRAGFSTVGPHREDMELLLNNNSVRIYGSQGQQRSTVLALKMAEAALLQKVIGEPPIAFLDDVMSELDVMRQDYILNHIEGWQVFITCCEPSAALRINAGSVFNIKQGEIIK